MERCQLAANNNYKNSIYQLARLLYTHKRLVAQARATEKRIKELQEKNHRLHSRLNRFQKYITYCLQTQPALKQLFFQKSRRLALIQGAPILIVDDIQQIPRSFVKEEGGEYSFNQSKILDAIERGEVIPGLHLERPSMLLSKGAGD